MREQLLGYLLGALEPQECEQLEAHLAHDRQLQNELERLQDSLEPLESDSLPHSPPPGLAERTCAMIRDKAASVTAASRSAIAEGGSRLGNWRFVDWAVGLSVLGAAVLLFFPALQFSRVNSQRTVCQNNLTTLARGQQDFSDRHRGVFPVIPVSGNLSAAGSYAPTLHDKQYFTDSHLVVCPASSLAQSGEFRIPSAEEVMAASGAQLVELRRMMGGSYGYHIGHMGNGQLQPTRNLHRSTFALMADAPSLHLANYQSANHGGVGQNVMFEDGHVSFMTTAELHDFQDNIYVNRFGQIAPGVDANDSVIGQSGMTPIIFVSSPNEH